ncbi:MAG: ImmA/IrrE family metallo-endopeptidase [Clostridiales bacterium]|nr:ImmA/IrrE family metallo-endopeptidase [Clostridiales bacterium]
MEKLKELYKLAEKYAIPVYCFPLAQCQSVSVMDGEGDCQIGIDPMQLHSEADEAVKLAHELGHCATGSFYNRYTPLDLREKHEKQAWGWAIQRLLPKDQLESAMTAGYTEPYALAEYLGLPEPFIRRALAYYSK